VPLRRLPLTSPSFASPRAFERCLLYWLALLWSLAIRQDQRVM
jgi:hypothetical protein